MEVVVKEQNETNTNNEILGGLKVVDAKQDIVQVTTDVDVLARIATTSLATASLLVEGDPSNGGPKVAAALLSLGQDLTTGEDAIIASVAPLAPSPYQQQPRIKNPLNPMTICGMPMVPTDSAINVDGATRTATVDIRCPANAINNEQKNKKRKSKENDGSNPPYFLYWLSPGESVGNWDVLCGRGGESNNYIGNIRYRKVVGEKKPEYRKIDVKQRKLKTNFVRDIVYQIKYFGGRFIDVDSEGRYYVVTDVKARKKTSQALRETKELKWLVDSYEDVQKENSNKQKTNSNKDVVCPFCKRTGHKTRIAKACLKHHEWLDINNPSKTAVDSTTKSNVVMP